MMTSAKTTLVLKIKNLSPQRVKKAQKVEMMTFLEMKVRLQLSKRSRLPIKVLSKSIKT